MSLRAVLRTDGGSRGNPGPAAAAFVLEDVEGGVVCSAGRYLGEATNNVAEYEALIWGLETALARGFDHISVLCDSELVVHQVNGSYRVKHENMKPLFGRVMALLHEFSAWEVAHVPRSENTRADGLVNEALDSRGTVGDAECPAADAPPAPQQSLFDETETAVPVAAGRASASKEETGVYELTVRGHFDAAHALRGYPGECRELHGHTWDVEVTVEAATLDEIGIVYDFKTLKADLAAVLAPYDHAYLNDVPPFDEFSPTAENLARVLYEALDARVDPRVRVSSVTVWESPVAKLVYRP